LTWAILPAPLLLKNKTTHKILNLCKQNNIQLTVHHLPGLDNRRADYLSCLYPQHEWSLAPHIFQALDQKWGPQSINHMASAANKKLPQFNSHFCNQGSKATDALLQDWHLKNNWVVPLIALIPKVVALLQCQWPSTTIIVPQWTGQPWFQELLWLCNLALVMILNDKTSFIAHSSTLPEPLQPALALDHLQDLWTHRTEGWSSNMLAMLDMALAPSTWK
jgi:hypothetical protein